ncbi:MAG TPA: ChaN family lipoprotein [Planctomycetota bacterium]|nr:ChaN family lipoprotein [Planctomycetota bacterium]
MSVRQELIEIQKRLVKHLKTDLYQEYCWHNPQIDQYYEDYKHLTGRYERIATKQEIVEQVLASDIVYLGDYHTLRQSQKTLIRLLEACRITPKTDTQHPIILGLEMIQNKHQDILNQYQNTKIDETAFLKAIDYDQTWGFDWKHYKLILDYAREHHLKVLALNSRPTERSFGQAKPSLSAKGEKASSLNRRDSLAAKIIAQTHRENPESTIIILFGDLHISENHLPLQVDKLTTPPPKKLIICQNSERIYWQLAQSGEEQKIDVVKIKDHVYCVMNSTPLTVFQSCIHWYNQERQMQTHPAHQDWSDGDVSTSFIDEVAQLIKTICEFLEMEAPKTDSLTVCTAQDMELLKHIKKETLSPEEAKHLETDLLKTESYFIENADTICLTNLSLNHAAEQASHFIHHKYTENQTAHIKRKTQDRFYYAVLREAMGFFGSKVINHKRLCYKELDFEDFINPVRSELRRDREHLPERNEHEREDNTSIRSNSSLSNASNGASQYRRKRLSTPRLKEVFRISQFVVEHKKREKDFLETNKWLTYKKVSYLSVEDFIGISHALGYMLGDRLYEGVLQGIIKRTEIHALFSNPFKGPEALNKYLHLVQRVQTVKETYQRKTDHM